MSNNFIYNLEPNEHVYCYLCLQGDDHTEYGKGQAYLTGASHTPCDGNAHHICCYHLDEDVILGD
jgi:hypothetical protein